MPERFPSFAHPGKTLNSAQNNVWANPRRRGRQKVVTIHQSVSYGKAEHRFRPIGVHYARWSASKGYCVPHPGLYNKQKSSDD